MTENFEDICKKTGKESNVLVIDLNEHACEEIINYKTDAEGSDCLKYSGIIFLERKDYGSSSPKWNKIKGVPVLTVHERDAKDILKAFRENQAVKIDILLEHK